MSSRIIVPFFRRVSFLVIFNRGNHFVDRRMDVTETSWIEMLLLLAKKGAAKGEVRISSSWLASGLSSSKQTAIRKLNELERKGMITRHVGTRGQTVKISQIGLFSLRAIQKELEITLKPSPRLFMLSGRVITGMGEGSYYMGQQKYIEQFKKELGFIPYPGTLDIKLEKDSIELKDILTRMPSGQVSGFSTKERTFGPVKFFRVKFKGSNGAIVFPNRTHHTDIVEIISPRNLRNKMGLNDGEILKVEVLA